MKDTLVKFEWVQLPGPGVRMKFRRDSTGFYEREGAPGTRLVRDNLLWEAKDGVLRLKFAHAREWTEVNAALKEAALSDDGRTGQWQLTLIHDPYVKLFDEKTTPDLVLVSDSGAALLG